MLILPAIDLRAGRCVRLFQGDYAQETVYSDDPIAMAELFLSQGARWLHLIDLDGAASGSRQNRDAVRAICRIQGLKVELGGGIRTMEAAFEALSDGVDRVIVGTKLVLDPGFASELFLKLGDKVVAGIDTRDGKVSIHGWTEESKEDGVEFAKLLEGVGCKRVIFTDVSTDGTLQGPNLQAMQAMVKAIRIPVIASGGVGSLEDLQSLAASGVEATIVGKALYERKFSLTEALSSVDQQARM